MVQLLNGWVAVNGVVVMRSYTAMSGEAIAAVQEELIQLPDGYEMRLNPRDSCMLVLALRAAYEHMSGGGCPGVEENKPGDADAVAEWAADFLSGIAETVGIEMV